MTAPPKTCGTYKGWFRHYRRDEAPCTDCSAAKSAYQAADMAARYAATVAVVRRHPSEYDVLFEQNRAKGLKYDTARHRAMRTVARNHLDEFDASFAVAKSASDVSGTSGGTPTDTTTGDPS